MTLVLVAVASFVVATFFGHGVHWMLHQRWSGIFHRAHMEHHVDLYPATDLVSGQYRVARWYHRGPVLFTPALVALLFILAFMLPWRWTVTFGAVAVSFGLLNDWMHDSFHLRGRWLMRFDWYRHMRRQHFVHHLDMRKNYGIVLFVWDRLFRTFRK